MFRSLLVANRGEIAVRVFRSARAMGLRCIAVHAEADRESLHVAEADEAVAIGPAPASESYLRIDRLLEAARRTGAEAIHPGYGFLSENPDFAEACAAAGIVFVGPPAAAMRAIGGKASAKALMGAAGVPLLPGYHGEDQRESTLAAEAARLGVPLLIKASAGGGGRGMRVVEKAEDFPALLASARREAEAAFGDGRVLLERHLARPRHIEVQVLADGCGTVHALSTRDCSIQRRYQKIVEEAPAPALPEAMRTALAEAAATAARAAGYVNAGTVEFIVENDRFYFMEMNTRLQVEHPVTEAVTGLDLVAWQLRIAAGERLPEALPAVNGHAVEVRLCAEEPAEGWRPATGRLTRLRLPSGEGVRVDTGVRAGDRITPFYDSMIAKIIAHGATRGEAIARLAAALDETEVEGVASNLGALRAIVSHPAFTDGVPTTGFIAAHGAAITAHPPPPREAVLAAAALLLDDEEASFASSAPPGPWDRRDGFRLVGTARRTLVLRDEAGPLRLEVGYGRDRHAIELDGSRHRVALRERGRDGRSLLAIDDRQLRILCWRDQDFISVSLPRRGTWRFRIDDALAPPRGDAAGDDRVAAPIPGRVAAVLCAEGQRVARGDVLVVVEAMKTELRIAAPIDGVVARIDVAPGVQVAEGAELVRLAPGEASATEGGR